jgi:hypothetical protein
MIGHLAFASHEKNASRDEYSMNKHPEQAAIEADAWRFRGDIATQRGDIVNCAAAFTNRTLQIGREIRILANQSVLAGAAASALSSRVSVVT